VYKRCAPAQAGAVFEGPLASPGSQSQGLSDLEVPGRAGSGPRKHAYALCLVTLDPAAMRGHAPSENRTKTARRGKWAVVEIRESD
jgi:hypothetical protein